MEKFRSELGDIELTEEYFERKRSSEEAWQSVEIEADEALDKAHFSKVEGTGLNPDSKIPFVKVKISGTWRKIPFEDTDTAEKFYTRFNYFWKSSRQRG